MACTGSSFRGRDCFLRAFARIRERTKRSNENRSSPGLVPKTLLLHESYFVRRPDAVAAGSPVLLPTMGAGGASTETKTRARPRLFARRGLELFPADRQSGCWNVSRQVLLRGKRHSRLHQRFCRVCSGCRG